MNIQDYLGIPWRAGGSVLPPNPYSAGLNCWELGQYIYQRELSVPLPSIQADGNNIRSAMANFHSNPELDNWHELTDPQHLCAVLMGKGKQVTHIGWFVDNGVLHSVQNFGVVYTEMQHLGEMGFGIKGFWGYNNG